VAVLLCDAEVNKKSGILQLRSAHKDILGFDVMVNNVVGVDVLETGYLWIMSQTDSSERGC